MPESTIDYRMLMERATDHLSRCPWDPDIEAAINILDAFADALLLEALGYAQRANGMRLRALGQANALPKG